MKRITKSKPTECSACQGIGYTRATCTEMVQQIDKDGRSRLITQRLGSGCPRCLGVGQLTRTDSSQGRLPA